MYVSKSYFAQEFYRAEEGKEDDISDLFKEKVYLTQRGTKRKEIDPSQMPHSKQRKMCTPPAAPKIAPEVIMPLLPDFKL